MPDDRKRMEAGVIYDPGAKEIMDEQEKYLEKLYDFNHTRPSEGDRRQQLLKEMFGKIGEGCYIEPPLHANWGGKNVYFGDRVYANFGLTLVDDGDIHVGDAVLFGPNVVVATANHPLEPRLRNLALQYNKEVRIGNNVWIGAGTVIVPGITIGDNSVIGAGSVVTKDIPENVVAVGNPCRVLRPIGEHDREYFYRDEKIDWDVVDKYLVGR